MKQEILIEELSVGNWVVDRSPKQLFTKPRQIRGIYNRIIYWTDSHEPKETSEICHIEPIEINAESIEKYVPALTPVENEPDKYKYENYKFLLRNHGLLVWDDELCFQPDDKHTSGSEVISIAYFQLRHIHQLQNFLSILK